MSIFPKPGINLKPGIYLVYTRFVPGTFEILRSVLQQNRNWNAGAHRFWITKVFSVHHSTGMKHPSPQGTRRHEPDPARLRCRRRCCRRRKRASVGVDVTVTAATMTPTPTRSPGTRVSAAPPLRPRRTSERHHRRRCHRQQRPGGRQLTQAVLL